MGGIIMTVRAHDARSAIRMIRPAPDGRRRAKDPGQAACHDENGVSEAADASDTRAQQPAAGTSIRTEDRAA
jgi:hypothetical protein